MLPGTQHYMLDQIRIATGTGNQHIARGKGEVLIYVRTVNYDHSLKAGLKKASSILTRQTAGQTNGLSSTLGNRKQDFPKS